MPFNGCATLLRCHCNVAIIMAVADKTKTQPEQVQVASRVPGAPTLTYQEAGSG